MSLGKKCLFVLGISLAKLGALCLINKSINYLAMLHGNNDHPKNHFFQWRFGDIFYTKKGTGSPVLLIHDLNVTSSSFEWNKTIEQLSKTNTVYAIDLLGCGLSAKPNLTYTNFLYVQLINDFIHAIIKESTDIIATGASASMCLSSKSYENSLVNRIILINPPDLLKSSKMPSKKFKNIRYILSTPIIGTFIYNLFTNKPAIRHSFSNYYFANRYNTSSNDVNKYFRNAQEDNAQGKFLLGSILCNYTNINPSYFLKNISDSIYIIVGDDLLKYELIAEQYKELLPSIEIEKISETSYLPQLEKPNQFIEQISILLDL